MKFFLKSPKGIVSLVVVLLLSIGINLKLWYHSIDDGITYSYMQIEMKRLNEDRSALAMALFGQLKYATYEEVAEVLSYNGLEVTKNLRNGEKNMAIGSYVSFRFKNNRLVAIIDNTSSKPFVGLN